ncbi:NADH dehydrogenase [ubiquinone] iron-sulfur protein 5-like [Danaus plexippus]|uniref:NADH dehydrogenase n=1 Tax=Danaus plexippus plexippus TaxID=278856 RepID=A0A212F858_DANPL|nr:NADH dehydrogenase [ubiquinone] iron-sulfur protein 5-like [Danaus plexippus]OWR49932.1 NADH dehydrogenase [Danaus plexippus plexippus]
MSDQVIPRFRNVFTDITGGIMTHQTLGDCAHQEMAMMDCMESYGFDRGLLNCKLEMDDYHECRAKTKQFLRFMALRRERDRKIACGELTGDNKYMSPKLDSF